MAAGEAVQVIDGAGALGPPARAGGRAGLEAWAEACGVAGAGVGYGVVAIMGPQSSGKSTLMNRVFGTGFREMDAGLGRRQTTRGVWASRSPALPEDCVLVLDLEGTDGRERGPDDTTFERQSALLALAAADVLLVNLWCHDIGREHGAGKPLLRTVLQENLKLFGGGPRGRRTALLFVIRDRSPRTPLDLLCRTLREDLESIWAQIGKPQALKEARLGDLFELHFTSLPNFEEREAEFDAEAQALRARFRRNCPEDGLMPSSSAVPGSAFAVSFQKLWETIRADKDLDLPAHQVMVATVKGDEAVARCLEDAMGSIEFIAINLNNLKKPGPGGGEEETFGPRVGKVLKDAIARFEGELEYFDPSVKLSKGRELVLKIWEALRPLLEVQLGVLRKGVAAEFAPKLGKVSPEAFAAGLGLLRQELADAFDGSCAALRVPGLAKECEGPMREARKRLLHEFDRDAASVRKAAVDALVARQRKALEKAVAAPLEQLFRELPAGLWGSVRAAVEARLGPAERALRASLAGFGLPGTEEADLVALLGETAEEAAQAQAEAAARDVGPRLKAAFEAQFSREPSGMPRAWGAGVDVAAVALAAREAAARALARLAVNSAATEGAKGWEEAQGAVERDLVALGAGSGASGGAAPACFASNEWPAAAGRPLLSPVECKQAWGRLESDIGFLVGQALQAQEARRKAGGGMPPAWAILAMLFLGWDDLLRLLYSPVRLILVLGLLVVARAMYVQLDVDAEMQRGLVPGLLSLSTKVVPAALEILRRLADESPAPTTAQPAGGSAASPMRRRPAPAAKGTQARATAPQESQTAQVTAEPAAESKKEQ